MNLEKEIICSEIINLSKQDRIQILTMIKRYDRNKVKEFSDGSRIYLNLLPDQLINSIYLKIKYILNLDS